MSRVKIVEEQAAGNIDLVAVEVAEDNTASGTSKSINELNSKKNNARSREEFQSTNQSINQINAYCFLTGLIY